MFAVKYKLNDGSSWTENFNTLEEAEAFLVVVNKDARTVSAVVGEWKRDKFEVPETKVTHGKIHIPKWMWVVGVAGVVGVGWYFIARKKGK